MMSSTEIQAGLSSILDRLNDSLSTAERDALYEALDGVASGLFDDRFCPFTLFAFRPSRLTWEGRNAVCGASALPHALPARQPAPIPQQK